MASSNLSRNQSAGTSTKKFTFSCWVKLCSESSTNGLISVNNGWADGTGFALAIHQGSIRQYMGVNGVGGGNQNYSTRLLRDPNAYYNLIFQADTDEANIADRMKVYVNGVLETSMTTGNNPAQGASWHNLGVNGVSMQVGSASQSNQYLDGYLSHAVFVDGSIVAPTVFGETDSTSGIWKFKSPSGITFGNNGFHLKFENSGAMGTDSSGNSNTFTVNGNLKQAVDTPSNVYAVWNKLDWGTNYSTLTNSGTTAQSNASAYPPAVATLGVDSGKWYWEIKYAAKDGGDDYPIIGITSTQATAVNNELGEFANDWGYYTNNTTPYYRNNGSQTSYGTAYTVGDIIGVAVDLENNKLYFSKNGTWQNSGVPTSGSTGTGAIEITDPASTPLGFYFPAVSYFDGSQRGTFHANFGNGYFGTTAITSAGSNGNGSLFEYDVPSGYYALNTKNLNTYG